MNVKPIVTSIAASGLLAALAIAQPPRYSVRDLGPVGNTPGQPYFITNNGLISGAAAASNGAMHAVLWYKGWIGDFGAPGLGGPNSAAFGINEKGQAVGQAETSVPNGEDFCGFNALGFPPSGASCVPFLWQDGVMTELPTLGGDNGVAISINNQGEVAGFAQNNTRDAGCPVAQFKPVIWVDGKVQQLPIPNGDPDGAAWAINDNGQAVGVSGPCAPFDPIAQVYFVFAHALLWQNGVATDLGTLGGAPGFGGNHACAINNQGQAIGHADYNGTTHGFLWQNGVMADLGTLSGDSASLALGINDGGEIVGISLDADFNSRAFLWQNGAMTDLNTLVGANPARLYLQQAESINARGEITGFAQTSAGETHAFIATPSNGAGESFSEASEAVARPVLSENARELLLRRLRVRP